MRAGSTSDGSADWGRSVLLGSAAGGLVATVVVVALTALLRDLAVARGALIGGLGTIVVLGLGTWVTLRVARAAPAVSLLAALGVFTLQGLVLLGVLFGLRALLPGPATTAGAVAVIVATVVWTTSFAVLLRRARIPLFDLSALSAPDGDRGASEARRPGE